jgi:hypothetical protein
MLTAATVFTVVYGGMPETTRILVAHVHAMQGSRVLVAISASDQAMVRMMKR